ncbi:cytochrome b [Rhodovulum kholense]|uniref:Uncharacterized protein n=1 Tax=Rhodovulum kholense TaxID=453584 RepID=A0A8E3AQQ0_9RHOB|nr:hypothetical protein [Rhodovulum kholense]PTW49955.1 hypothetical protein C8N38_106217 [Rhodovulum kholense]
MDRHAQTGAPGQTAERAFNRISKFFRWIMAAPLLIAWILGYYGGAKLHYGVNDAETAQKIWAITTDKSIAALTIFLIVARSAWRATHRPPALDAAMPPRMQRATHLGHFALYLLMIAVPL